MTEAENWLIYITPVLAQLCRNVSIAGTAIFLSDYSYKLKAISRAGVTTITLHSGADDQPARLRAIIMSPS